MVVMNFESLCDVGKLELDLTQGSGQPIENSGDVQKIQLFISENPDQMGRPLVVLVVLWRVEEMLDA